MNDLRKVVVIAGAEQHFALASNFIIAILTSRLMPANDIGIALVGTAVISLFAALREYAAPSFLIKNSTISVEETNGAITGMLLVNAVLLLGLVLAAPLIGTWYDDPRLVLYLRIIALGLAAEALYLPIVAVMRRAMAFDKAASVSMTCAAVMTVSTVALAAAGYNYLSFCLGFACGNFAAAAVAILQRPTFWLIRPNASSWRMLLGFGRSNGTYVVLRQLTEAAPYLILGQIFPTEAVAYYHRALMLSQLPGKLLLGGVETMMLPHLSAEIRSHRDVKAPLLRVFECVTVVYWPALLMLAIFADPVVRMLYGPSWVAVVPLLQVMALAMLFTFLGKLDSTVLVATGGMDDLLRASLIGFPIYAMISMTAAYTGLHALAWSFWAVCPLQLAISMHFIRRQVPFSWSELVSAVSKSAIATILTCIVPLAVLLTHAGDRLSLSSMVLATSGAVLTWLLALWGSSHPMLTAVLRRPVKVAGTPT